MGLQLDHPKKLSLTFVDLYRINCMVFHQFQYQIQVSFHLFTSSSDVTVFYKFLFSFFHFVYFFLFLLKFLQLEKNKFNEEKLYIFFGLSIILFWFLISSFLDTYYSDSHQYLNEKLSWKSLSFQARKSYETIFIFPSFCCFCMNFLLYCSTCSIRKKFYKN